MGTILKLEDLCYSYIDGGYERQILKNLSFEFEEKKFYTILGPSGSGKTTLLSIIAGLDFAKSGHVYFRDKEITKSNVGKYRRNDISIVFQQYNLISYLTAVENVMLAMSETDNELPKDKKNVAYNLLERFGIVRSKADRMVGQLSGGEQQRVSIARSLASNVDLIFADEPTGNLDTATEVEIINVFKQLAEDYGKTIIVVTHSNQVAEMSDQRVLLKDGILQKI
ncbi:MAG: ABC transporter ATP-binding protein [Solobacterium sp.]|nr:ABC transporter ATP-binding protein [Solobacterium sp.]MCI7732663.1 ABC transporter ATP-binding protein [Solobacterium sp.]MDD6122684.1 ABC transporter ATP-binding protein [Solobacterium sp.]MDD6498238.1 ABC transporter ATP-binding protein [Solobacterium sp.]MDD6885603.1 ABC transporter ATP-binding protein [Solobacterium sp.]